MFEKSNRYEKDFQLNACRQVTDRGYSIKRAAQELESSDWSLRQWMMKFKVSGELVVDQQSETVAKELRRLRTENAQLRMEKETASSKSGDPAAGNILTDVKGQIIFSAYGYACPRMSCAEWILDCSPF